MKLFKRLKFAMKFNLEDEFCVYSPNIGWVRFLRYEDAKAFADKESEYELNIFVAVQEGSQHD